MEAVLKNLANTTELLAVAQTEFVNQWDEHTVDRALQWTRYCEHLYARFHSNPTISAALDNCLQETNEHLRTTFEGYQDLTFSDLAQCQHMLLVCLLKNPAAPHCVIKLVFDSFRQCEAVGDAGHANQIAFDLAALVRYKSACHVLCAANLSRKASVGLHLEAQVQGMMLRERLDTLLSQAGNNNHAKNVLDSVLKDCSGFENISDVIAGALLSSKDVTRDFILDWCQGNHGLLLNVCHTLSIELLTKLTRESIKFMQAYWGILKEWASSLDYDITKGEWVQQTCDKGVSFKTLAGHLGSLLGSGPPLKEETEKKLAALKQGEGDFEVKGLSVWGDLLTELV